LTITGIDGRGVTAVVMTTNADDYDIVVLTCI